MLIVSMPAPPAVSGGSTTRYAFISSWSRSRGIQGTLHILQHIHV